jgi:predicted ABC-type ATPase
VVVLGGPNGAGKTTAARSVLAETLSLLTFVNADVIAQGLAGFDPDSAAMEAGRIMLERLHSLAELRASFALESTLSGRTLATWLQKIRMEGYAVHLIYFWVESADTLVARVAQRVREGGHDIPEQTIRRRFQRSIRNFFHLYRPLTTTWAVYDNSERGVSRMVAWGGPQGQEMILSKERWELLLREARS